MKQYARPLRSTRRVANLVGDRPTWYSVRNAASAGQPAIVSIYDEIGMYGVSADGFVSELRNITGDVQLHINSPGGDVFEAIAIYNALTDRQGKVSITIDGLAASAASFIAMAASPGELEMAPHSKMMIHDGFGMAIGNAADMRKTADLLDEVSNDIAEIYAARTGKPTAQWRTAMQVETWYSDQEAVDAGLADRVRGQDPPVRNDWDMSVFAHYAGVAMNAGPVVVNAEGGHVAMTGTHKHSHPAYGSQGGDAVHSHEHSHDGDASHGHHKAAPASTSDDVTDQLDTVYCPQQYQRTYNETAQCPKCRLFNSSDAKFCDQCGTKLVGRTDVAEIGSNGQLMRGGKVVNADDGEPTDLGDGWVMDPDGTTRFDPDGDGDDDSSPGGDTDNDYWDADGNQLQDIPPCPEVDNSAGDDDAKKAFPGAAPPFKKKDADNRSAFPVLNADVDDTPWNASKAWAAGAASDDPAKFYAGICAGRKAGDASTQAAWALPYKYSPSSPPNAAGVRNALSRLPQAKGLTNADEAKATLQKAMRQVNPDWEPDARIDSGVLASVFTLKPAEVDDSSWDPAAAMASAAAAEDPAAFYRGICAGRRQGDPATPEAWALPYRYTPSSAPNASGVRHALASLPAAGVANPGQARDLLEKAMKKVDPDFDPDGQIDAGLLGAALALGLEGARLWHRRSRSPPTGTGCASCSATTSG